MKKLMAIVIVCGFTVAMLACGGQKSETTDTEMDSMEETSVDSTVMDSTVMDSTVNAVVDSASKVM